MAQNLRKSGLWDPLLEWLRAGRPYLGICLGYQLLFESSEESPGCKGSEFSLARWCGSRRTPEGSAYWLEYVARGTRTHLQHVALIPYFYFVHSYFPVPADDHLVSARCEYGGLFAASVSSGSLHATQFHPEKSQTAGLTLLRNFLNTLA